MFCEQCGTKLNDTAKFCSNCGASLTKVNNINIIGTADLNTDSVPVTPIAEVIPEPAVAETVPEVVPEPAVAEPVAEVIPEPAVVEPVPEVVPEPVAVASVQQSNQDFDSQQYTAQVCEQPIPTPQVTDDNKPPKKAGKILVRILSVFICVFLFVTSLLTVTIMTAREIVDEDTVSDIVEDIDVDAYIDSGALDEILSDDVNEDDIKKIYEEGTFREYFKDVLGEYSGYILNGEKPKGIEYDEVREVVKDNEELIYEVTGHRVSRGDYSRIKNYIDEEAEKDLGVLVSGKIEGPVNSVRMAISIYAVIALILLSVLFGLLLFIIRKTKTNGFLWCGITLALSSITFAVIGFIIPMLVDVGNDAVMTAVKSVLEDNIVVKFCINGGIMLGTSLLLIATYIVIRLIKNSRAQKSLTNNIN